MRTNVNKFFTKEHTAIIQNNGIIHERIKNQTKKFYIKIHKYVNSVTESNFAKIGNINTTCDSCATDATQNGVRIRGRYKDDNPEREHQKNSLRQ
jgi:uncharacterized protein YpiB (UPF0302 family)